MQICDAILRENRGIKDHNRDKMYYFLFSANPLKVFPISQMTQKLHKQKINSLSFIRN